MFWFNITDFAFEWDYSEWEMRKWSERGNKSQGNDVNKKVYL